MIAGELRARHHPLPLSHRRRDLRDRTRLFAPAGAAQCRDGLRKRRPRAVSSTTPSTAAAREAAADTAGAAIGSRLAAELYAYRYCARGFRTNDNATRFVVLGTPRRGAHRRRQDDDHLRGARRTRRAATRAPGLRRWGEPIRIESRPNRRRAWDYLFVADLDGHRSDANIPRDAGAERDLPDAQISGAIGGTGA